MEKDCGRLHRRPEPKDNIGFQIGSLSRMIGWLIHQYGGEEKGQAGAGMHGWLIGFLYDNRDRDVFQRDLQQQLSVRRSTMTGILQTLERDGMITRSPVPWDARLKKIELTDKAVAHQEKFQKAIEAVEARVSSGLTQEEQATFLRLCEKIRRSLED